jgi:hypothetical protein
MVPPSRSTFFAQIPFLLCPDRLIKRKPIVRSEISRYIALAQSSSLFFLFQVQFFTHLFSPGARCQEGLACCQAIGFGQAAQH